MSNISHSVYNATMRLLFFCSLAAAGCCGDIFDCLFGSSSHAGKFENVDNVRGMARSRLWVKAAGHHHSSTNCHHRTTCMGVWCVHVCLGTCVRACVRARVGARARTCVPWCSAVQLYRSHPACASVRASVLACVRLHVRQCVRPCVRACVRAYKCAHSSVWCGL